MIRLTHVASLAVCSCLTSFTPLWAASPTTTPVAASSPAEKCLGDVRDFSGQMSKDGYWLGDSGYGYGYPMGGYGYGVPLGGMPVDNGMRYGSVRQGYEIRTLVASATILAQMGEEQQCQGVLATTRTMYTRYAADLHDQGIHAADLPGWKQRMIATAVPVTGTDVSFRSDQLLDADVVSPSDETLGSVHDMVLNPHTGKIAYLIIARGGLFGIDAEYVPIPWGALKATPNATLLVLDTTKAAMKAAPRVSNNQFAATGKFDEVSQTVDTYWASRVKILAAAE